MTAAMTMLDALPTVERWLGMHLAVEEFDMTYSEWRSTRYMGASVSFRSFVCQLYARHREWKNPEAERALLKLRDWLLERSGPRVAAGDAEGLAALEREWHVSRL